MMWSDSPILLVGMLAGFTPTGTQRIVELFARTLNRACIQRSWARQRLTGW